MWTYNHSDELMHHGVKGMKWGVRKDRQSGSSSGKSKLSKKIKKTIDTRKKKKAKERAEEARAKAKAAPKKSVKDMSDDELRTAINRLRMEDEYNRYMSNLHPKRVSTGEKFLKNVVEPAIMQSSKTLLTDYTTKKGKEFLGLNQKDDDPLKDLRKTVEKLNLEKQYKDLSDVATRELRNEVTKLALEEQRRKLKENK